MPYIWTPLFLPVSCDFIILISRVSQDNLEGFHHIWCKYNIYIYISLFFVLLLLKSIIIVIVIIIIIIAITVLLLIIVIVIVVIIIITYYYY